MPRVSFKTVGCRLNQAETAKIRAQLKHAGCDIVDFGEPCDISVVHGCTITREAERKSARFARSARSRLGTPVVVLMGCAAEIGQDNIKQASGADLVVSQADKWRLPEFLAAAGILEDSANIPHTTPVPDFSTTRALVRVQDGCDFRCTYCIVPDARGLPTSRKVDSIIGEVEALAAKGYREFVITGANLACYRDGYPALIELLSHIESVPGVARIRLSSIELSGDPRSLIDHMVDSDAICPFLHFPLQSGDDDILARMGRRYTASEFASVVTYAADRLHRPGLGADIIVGFPGEDDNAFENTYNLVSRLPLNNLHVFPYSPRPGTPAASMPDQLPRQVKKERVARLVQLGQAKRDDFAARLLGTDVSVLIEEINEDGEALGWTPEYVQARVSGSGLRVNAISEVTVSAVEGPVLHCS